MIPPPSYISSHNTWDAYYQVLLPSCVLLKLENTWLGSVIKVHPVRKQWFLSHYLNLCFSNVTSQFPPNFSYPLLLWSTNFILVTERKFRHSSFLVCFFPPSDLFSFFFLVRVEAISDSPAWRSCFVNKTKQMWRNFKVGKEQLTAIDSEGGRKGGQHLNLANNFYVEGRMLEFC